MFCHDLTFMIPQDAGNQPVTCKNYAWVWGYLGETAWKDLSELLAVSTTVKFCSQGSVSHGTPHLRHTFLEKNKHSPQSLQQPSSWVMLQAYGLKCHPTTQSEDANLDTPSPASQFWSPNTTNEWYVLGLKTIYLCSFFFERHAFTCFFQMAARVLGVQYPDWTNNFEYLTYPEKGKEIYRGFQDLSQFYSTNIQARQSPRSKQYIRTSGCNNLRWPLASVAVTEQVKTLVRSTFVSEVVQGCNNLQIKRILPPMNCNSVNVPHQILLQYLTLTSSTFPSMQ